MLAQAWLTFARANTPFPAVRLFRIALVPCFVAVWLLATQHCGLEAAGMWGSNVHAANCCPNGEGCTSDGCNVVEQGAYKPASDTLKVSTPDLFACVCLLCASTSLDLSEGLEALLPPSRERPSDWAHTWQFVQRAALSPRAPSLV